MTKERRSESRRLEDRVRKYVLAELIHGFGQAVDSYAWKAAKRGRQAITISSAGEFGEGGEDDGFWADETTALLRAEGERLAKFAKMTWKAEDARRRSPA